MTCGTVAPPLPVRAAGVRRQRGRLQARAGVGRVAPDGAAAQPRRQLGQRGGQWGGRGPVGQRARAVLPDRGAGRAAGRGSNLSISSLLQRQRWRASGPRQPAAAAPARGGPGAGLCAGGGGCPGGRTARCGAHVHGWVGFARAACVGSTQNAWLLRACPDGPCGLLRWPVLCAARRHSHASGHYRGERGRRRCVRVCGFGLLLAASGLRCSMGTLHGPAAATCTADTSWG